MANGAQTDPYYTHYLCIALACILIPGSQFWEFLQRHINNFKSLANGYDVDKIGGSLNFWLWTPLVQFEIPKFHEYIIDKGPHLPYTS